MNNYPIWWDSKITVYNQFKDPVTKIVKWYSTKLSNCFWKNVGNKVSIGEVVLDTSSLVCRIPESRKYLDKVKWVSLSNDKMGRYFTLQPGDIIVLGHCDDEINEYVANKHSNDFLSNHKGNCMVIKQVGIDTMTGTNNLHYHIIGD